MVGAFGLLLAAIATEVAATLVLPRADGFRDPLWSSIVLRAHKQINTIFVNGGWPGPTLSASRFWHVRRVARALS